MIRSGTFAHLSDLHIGRSERDLAVARTLCRALRRSDIDTVLLTGDITHRGRHSEWEAFREAFAPLLRAERVVMVPGNHDCLGDDLRQTIMPGGRVQIWRGHGMHVVRFDSTAEHNRKWLNGHGRMDREDVEAISAAVEQAGHDDLAVLMLHHHLLPEPADYAAERLVSWLGWPFAAELTRGAAVLALLQGRCDLVLYGHRHHPRETELFGDTERPLLAFNAGSSTEIGRARTFFHSGRHLSPPRWVTGDLASPLDRRPRAGGTLVPALRFS